MNTTTPLRPKAAGFDDHRPHLARPDGLSRGVPFPEPHVEKIRGPKLLAIWAGLAAGAWGVVAGVGYGAYVVWQSIIH
ncbi:hypothetical protein [Azospirillum sp. sgz302134]